MSYCIRYRVYHPGKYPTVPSWSMTGSNDVTLIQQCQYFCNQHGLSSLSCQIECIERSK